MDIDGEGVEVGSFTVNIPVHATIGDQVADDDGRRYVKVHTRIDPTGGFTVDQVRAELDKLLTMRGKLRRA